MHILDESDPPGGFEGGFALGVRDLRGGSGDWEFLFGGFEGLFGEFLLGSAGDFSAGAGGVALRHGGWL